jgi:hypothetical protein
MPDVGIVIVTWNVRDLVVQALHSLYADLATSGLTYRVIVVDSASHDDTVAVVQAQFPQVELIASAENLGFGRANNVGLRRLGFGGDSTTEALPRAVYLLNPDTITHSGAMQALYTALFADPRIGFQHSAFAFPGLRQLWTEFFWVPGRFIEGTFNGRYPLSLYQGNTPFRVDFTLGATMLLRREVIQQTGGFDEAFFMYAEEVDWAWRIRQAGWQAVCVPTAHVTHLAGKSTSQVRPRSLLNLWESRLRLYRQHYPAWKLFVARQLVAWGMQRKIQQTQQDPQLTTADREALLAAYRTVYQMARK